METLKSYDDLSINELTGCVGPNIAVIARSISGLAFSYSNTILIIEGFYIIDDIDGCYAYY